MSTEKQLDDSYAYLKRITETQVPEHLSATMAGITEKLERLYAKKKAYYKPNGEWRRDPAMGTISITRRTYPLDAPQRLFGLETPIFSLMEISIHHAEVNINTGEIRPLDRIVHLQIAESEWAKSLGLSTQTGGLVNLIEENGEKLPAYDHENDIVNKTSTAMAGRLEDGIRKQQKKHELALKEIIETLGETKKIGKRQASAISHALSLGLYKGNFGSNVLFSYNRMIEHAEKVSIAMETELRYLGKGYNNA